MEMPDREGWVSVLEGTQGQRERDRAHLSKDCLGTSLTEIKHSKAYRKSGEGIGWRCGHRKDMVGTDLLKRKLEGLQINSFKDREVSGEESSGRGSITIMRDRSCKM